jgi:hypothetical protein
LPGKDAFAITAMPQDATADRSFARATLMPALPPRSGRGHFIANARRWPSFRRRAFLQYAAAIEKTTTTTMARDHISSCRRMMCGNTGVIAARCVAVGDIELMEKWWRDPCARS